ncbi:hypothetical protein HG531_003265 [Fusarium graminearum]|nr:hypothetical protein HG531_003265 [Fusarium graminearum]
MPDKFLLVILLGLGSNLGLGTEILLMVPSGFQVPGTLLLKTAHFLLQDGLFVLVPSCNLALGVTKAGKLGIRSRQFSRCILGALGNLLNLGVLLFNECFQLLTVLLLLCLRIFEVGVGHVQISLEVGDLDIKFLDLVLKLLLLFANLHGARPGGRSRLKPSGTFLGVTQLDSQLINTSLQMVPAGLNSNVLLTNLTQTRHELVNSFLGLLRLVLLPKLQFLSFFRLVVQLPLSVAKLLLEAFNLGLCFASCL